MLRNLFGRYGWRKQTGLAILVSRLLSVSVIMTVLIPCCLGDDIALPSADARVSTSFTSDFEMLIKNTFGRISPEIQIECRHWSESFTNRYSEEVFDSLIERFIATSTYRRLRREAEVLQSSPEAKKLAIRIDSMALQVPVLWRRYRNLKREALDISLFSGLERDMVLRRRVDEEARRAFEDYLETYQRHNRLVAEYNKNYLGGLEFFTEHLGGFEENRLEVER